MDMLLLLSSIDLFQIRCISLISNSHPLDSLTPSFWPLKPSKEQVNRQRNGRLREFSLTPRTTSSSTFTLSSIASILQSDPHSIDNAGAARLQACRPKQVQKPSLLRKPYSMSSYVAEFLINPVLRQARRFSEISRSTFGGEDEIPPAHTVLMDSETVDILPQEPVHTRTLSSSTQETIVEEPFQRPETTPVNSIDHVELAASPRRRKGPIPEDDGMGVLRARIQSINARDLPSSERARLLHDLILEGYRSSMATSSRVQNAGNDVPVGQMWEHEELAGPLESLRFWQNRLIGEASAKELFTLSESDIAPTYTPIRHPKTASATPTSSSSTIPDVQPRLGCEHYERNVKLQCSTCKKWYTCRFCHDSREDHTLIRHETKNMLCMLCATPQRASDICIKCGEITAQYYCNICKLWENRPNKPIYHCNDCGICRRGLGIGKDFFHCKTCRACITTSIESSHKCIERSTDCDCPICGEYMFTSPKPVVFMNCGHSIHKKCYEQHLKVSYKCPLCNKSLANMETQFRNLDAAIQLQPMPSEFRDTQAKILCNDCSGRSCVPYHWLGLKCYICHSYNTVELQMISGNMQSPQESVLDRVQAPQISPVSGELPSREVTSAARPTPISADSRMLSNFTVRRRHSSNAVEPLSRILDRIVRSASPPGFLMEYGQASLGFDDESDDDMLGFWRRDEANEPDENGLETCPEGDEEEDEEEDEEDEGDDEEEEDDENEIILFGHW